ncbi:MAG: polyprenyl diphosphate synthase [Pseudomonadota bacterium]
MAPEPLTHAQPLHVGIIMDGNGRWADKRGLRTTDGHVAGVGALKRTVTAAPRQGITTLSIYAFSSYNWARPADEVGALMSLMADYLSCERAALEQSGIRLTVFGRRDRIPRALVDEIANVELATAKNTRLHLRIAIDYSGRADIIAAISRLAPGEVLFGSLTADRVSAALAAQRMPQRSNTPPTDVDLIIRTGGDQRLSDFLVWEAAYAELLFSKVLWPDFGEAELVAALSDYHGRQRRYGARPA